MKVLFLNYEYPPLGGGAGNATHYLLKEYAGIPDLEVCLVTSSVDGEFHRENIGKRVIVHRIPIGKNANNLHYQSTKDIVAYAWQGYRWAKRLMQKERFDVIHAFFTVPCGVMAYFLSRRFDTPYIVSLRGADVPGFSERFGLWYAVLKPMIRLVWKRASGVVAASQGLKELAQKTAPRQVMLVVPNGIAVEEFPMSQGSSDGRLRILSTSRLTPRKGLRYLIEAFAILRDTYSVTNVEAILVGDGHERGSLEKLAQERGVSDQVRFVGRVLHERLSEWYAKADCFVLPSFNEGMSNAMLEALAAGLPLLVTDTGGTAEALEKGKNGFEIRKGSAEDLAEKIALLAGDAHLRKSFAITSRSRAEKLSWKNAAEQYIGVYIRITKKP